MSAERLAELDANIDSLKRQLAAAVYERRCLRIGKHARERWAERGPQLSAATCSPAALEKQRSKAKAAWADPMIRARRVAGIKGSQAKRVETRRLKKIAANVGVVRDPLEARLFGAAA